MAARSVFTHFQPYNGPWYPRVTAVTKRFPSQYNFTCKCNCSSQQAVRYVVGISHNHTTRIHRHTHQAILDRIHPENLYRIINNVDEYQQFLPYCTESRILQSSPCGTMYDAVLRVGLPGLSTLISSSLVEERYISRVRMSPPIISADGDKDHVMPMTWTIEAKSIQSRLFDTLKSRWQLTLAQNHPNNILLHDQGAEYEIDTIIKGCRSSSCRVQFEVEIQVSNPLVSLTLDQVLKDVAKQQVDAFERRCKEKNLRR